MDGHQPRDAPRTDVVILVTRLNGAVFALNPDLVERADCTPDTDANGRPDGEDDTDGDGLPNGVDYERFASAAPSVIGDPDRVYLDGNPQPVLESPLPDCPRPRLRGRG